MLREEPLLHVVRLLREIRDVIHGQTLTTADDCYAPLDRAVEHTRKAQAHVATAIGRLRIAADAARSPSEENDP